MKAGGPPAGSHLLQDPGPLATNNVTRTARGFSDEFLTDPFPALGALREAGPAVHLTRYGVWAVAGYREVHAVLRDHERFSSAAGVGLANLITEPYGWRKPSLILEVDPPVHTSHRALVVAAMNPRAMRAFQEVFDAEAAILADDLARRGRFDAVRDLAEIFPSVVFPRALGVEGDTREALLAYGSLSFNAIGPRNRHLEAALRRGQGVPEWIAAHCARRAGSPCGHQQGTMSITCLTEYPVYSTLCAIFGDRGSEAPPLSGGYRA